MAGVNAVVTRGYGSPGSISYVPTRGYTPSTVVLPDVDIQLSLAINRSVGLTGTINRSVALTGTINRTVDDTHKLTDS